MSNLIRSDIYRLRKGTRVRNTFIATFGIILLFWFIYFVSGLSGAPAGTTLTIEADRSIGIGVVDTAIALSGGVDFARELIGQNITAFLLLPLFTAVFTDDFHCGTYRNLLSFETNRRKVYWQKLLVSWVLTMLLVLFIAVAASLVGGIAFGFGGMFTAQYLARTVLSILFMAPLYLALVSFGHMVTAITRKQGSTIAVYFVTLLVYSSVVQLVASMLPGYEWVTLIDFLSGFAYLTYYWMIPGWEVGFYVGHGIVVSLLCSLVGVHAYAKADMN